MYRRLATRLDMLPFLASGERAGLLLDTSYIMSACGSLTRSSLYTVPNLEGNAENICSRFAEGAGSSFSDRFGEGAHTE